MTLVDAFLNKKKNVPYVKPQALKWFMKRASHQTNISGTDKLELGQIILC